MSLSNPNPLLKRLLKRDPDLFLKKDVGKFSSYSTSCQPVSRHPVILTDEEFKKTDPKSYSHSYTYGTDPGKQHHFICPRFWCFLTNRAISEADAMAHVAGFVLVNDLSEREFQLERGGQWDKGKSCDTFNPLGPWLATADEVEDAQQLDMCLNVNGERRQTGNTRTMIFGCLEIVRYISQFMTLEAGDVISTGTPPGVGLGMKPPQYLKVGDVLELGISGLGFQKQTCVAHKL